MKKFYNILAAAAIALSICACDKTNNNPESSNGESSVVSTDIENSTGQTVSTGTENSNTPTEPSVPVCFDKDVPSDIASCSTDEGFYYMECRGGSGYLRYIDYATQNDVFVCSDSSCKHDTERCTSVFSLKEFYIGSFCYSLLFFYDGNLYLLSIKDDGSAEGISSHLREEDPNAPDQALYRMNPDGTNRQKIYTFEKGIGISGSVICCGDNISFFTRIPTIEKVEATGRYYRSSKNKTMITLSLSQQKIVEQIPLYKVNGVEPDFKGFANGRIILCGTDYHDGLTEDERIIAFTSGELGGGHPEWYELEKNNETIFFEFITETKEIKEIKRAKYNYYFCHDVVGEPFVSTSDTSAPWINLGKGNNLSIDGYKILDYFAGRFIVVSNSDPKGNYYFFDPDTGEIKLFDLKTHYPGNDMFSLQYVTHNSDMALVIYEYDGTVDSGGFYSSLEEKYALITLDDLFNSRPNYKPIKKIV